MNEENLGERVARIEGAQELMVKELRRARNFGWVAWIMLAAFVVAVAAVGVNLAEAFVQNCGIPWQ